MLSNRAEQVYSKGFDMYKTEDIGQPDNSDLFYSKVKFGAKTIEDANVTLDATIGKDVGRSSNFLNKTYVLEQIASRNVETLKEISEYYYQTSGIYSRLCRYMAFLYKYDWKVTPYINAPELVVEDDDLENNVKINKKITKNFNKVLHYLDVFNVKKNLNDIALKVVTKGCYYGYLVRDNSRTSVAIQELPISYCRSRYTINTRPVVEFKMSYFDTTFPQKELRKRVLEMFPEDFRRGYRLYERGALKSNIPNENGWYTLDIDCAFKFTMNDDDCPPFASVIPDIIDLNNAKILDLAKMEQQLQKLIVQKLPLDKNGDPLFDNDEAIEIHKNATRMLSHTIGARVLTTFAEVSVEDVADSDASSTADQLERVERSVYNEAGVSQMQFNTDGNIALEKSLLNDEASMGILVTKFEDFLNQIILPFNINPARIYYKVMILPTTIYNYKELSKMYKEQMQVGQSKMLGQIALGQPQSAILADAYFENEVLNLVNVLIPPLMSSTMNADVLDKKVGTHENVTKTTQEMEVAGEETQRGRKELSDDQKSEKTIQNRESMS